MKIGDFIDCISDIDNNFLFIFAFFHLATIMQSVFSGGQGHKQESQAGAQRQSKQRPKGLLRNDLSLYPGLKTPTPNMEFILVLFRPLLLAEARQKPTHTTDECLDVPFPGRSV